MMKFKSKSSALFGLLFLAACGSSAVAVKGIDTLGSGFKSIFAADANAEPTDPQSVQISAISFTDEPFNP